MTSEKLEAMFSQPDIEAFKLEASRWQAESLIRLYRRLNKRAGEIKRSIIPGGQAAFDFCVDKMDKTARIMADKFKIVCGINPDGRSFFIDAESGNPVLINGQIPGNN